MDGNSMFNKTTFKRMFHSTILILLLLIIGAILLLQYRPLGKAPSGERLARMKQSPNYRKGKFENIMPTTMITKGHSMAGQIYQMIFEKVPRKRPADSLPFVKTDLLHLSPDSDVMVWFGHSSYFLQVYGKRFLIDPVFSGNLSPVPFFGNRAFKGTDVYSVDDLPCIDYLLLTHDHYDHLDYKTLTGLIPKVSKVICGLGVGEHLEYWGYAPSRIIEKDWNETISIAENYTIHTATARHGSGRLLSTNNTLWLSYILETPTKKLYLGGDSGYGAHFAEIGQKFGPFDVAVLDNGQYNVAWQNIHLLPEEVIRAAKDLRANRLFPVHSSKFVLGRHPWDEPLIRIAALGEKAGLPLVTPMIGEVVNLNAPKQEFKHWWEGVK
jgi:L-ascorbate metabolism protein UlaG (beta-lactamase superfamily)